MSVIQQHSLDLRVCCAKSGETVEILEHRSFDITCIIQETRFRGKSVRMINEKAAEYKLVWIGNEKG